LLGNNIPQSGTINWTAVSSGKNHTESNNVPWKDIYENIIKQAGFFGVSYAIHDIDKNGIPELFISTNPFSAISFWDVFTLDENNEPKRIYSFENANSLVYMGNSSMLIIGESRYGQTKERVTLNGNKVENRISSFYTDSDRYVVYDDTQGKLFFINDVRVTENDYMAYVSSYLDKGLGTEIMIFTLSPDEISEWRLLDPARPNFVNLLYRDRANFNHNLAAEGINNATSAYWHYFNNGQMFIDNGYYDFVYMVDGEITSLYSEGLTDISFSENGLPNVIFCLKDIYIDGMPRTMVNISIRGTESLADWITNFMFTALEGRHRGFARNAEIIAKSESEIYFQSLDMTLRCIIEMAVDGSNDFFIFINGHSQGAAVANIYAHDLFERNVSASNMAGYTYATPLTFISGFSDSPITYPIFNILNHDDTVTRVGVDGYDSGMRMGTDKVFFPDNAFRLRNYGYLIDYLNP
jgi:hypothetical protein